MDEKDDSRPEQREGRGQDVTQWTQQQLGQHPVATIFACLFLGFLLGTLIFSVACRQGRARLSWWDWLNGSGAPAVALIASLLPFLRQ